MWKKPEDLPELFPEYDWLRSKNVPVIVLGQDGWSQGYYHRGHGGYEQWRIVGFNGNYEITAWFDLPEGENMIPERFRQTPKESKS